MSAARFLKTLFLFLSFLLPWV